MHPALGSGRGHAETREKGTPEAEAEEHEIDNLRRVSLIRPVSQPGNFKSAAQRWQDKWTSVAAARWRTGLDRSIPYLGLEVEDLGLLFGRSDL